MAKRKDIRSILDDESLDTETKTKRILDMIHEESDALRDERDNIQSELDKAKAERDTAVSEREKLSQDFETFKTTQSQKDSRSAKENAYKALLGECGIGEKHLKLILKASDIDSLELDKDGKLKGMDKLSESIKADYSDYISVESEHGANFDEPPSGRGGHNTMTKADIMAIKDTAKRQAAIAENHELFGF